MAFAFHPSFEQNIQQAEQHLLASITDETARIKSKPQPPELAPDAHVEMELSEEDMRGPGILTEVDVNNRAVSYIFPVGNRLLGLTDDAFTQALRLAESIWKHKQFWQLVTKAAVETAIFSWLASKARGNASDSLVDVCLKLLNEEIKETTVWIPVDNLKLQAPLPFGLGVIRMATKSEILEIFQPMAASMERYPILESAQREWAGQAVVEFRLRSHPSRAVELASSYADDYISLLQFFGAPPLFAPLSSHVAPRGQRPYRKRSFVQFGSHFGMGTNISEAPWEMTIRQADLARMNHLGLQRVSRLAAKAESNYEKNALRALLVYGRASYADGASDKLLRTMTALEMFALRNQSEPIGNALAERLAFTITLDPTQRPAIARNLREAYQLRSRLSHHGQSLNDEHVAEQFLKNVWSFFLVVIQNMDRFATKESFLDAIENKKWGIQ